MKQRIVLLGPPASGKGSQARMISQKYDIQTVSTGHLMRDEATAGTALGRKAARFTSKGELAPDDLVMAVLEKWIGSGRNAFVLDGFPRTIKQAEMLTPMLDSFRTPLEVVISLECGFPIIEDRVLNRVTCSQCGQTFKRGLHVEIGASVCPSCGGFLSRRGDDTSAVLAQRMVQYAERTAPLVEFYRQQGLLQKVNAEAEIPAVFAALECLLHS